MSRTNHPESDVRVKTFQLQTSSDEEAMNSFLAGKAVRYWEAEFAPAAVAGDSSVSSGGWNIFVAYQERETPLQTHGAGNRQGRQAPMLKRQGSPAVSLTTAEKADKVAEARKPVEAYKPHVPEEDMPLFESIRTWRNSRAREERVKPFSFFNNAQLEQIVLAKPASSDALKAIATNMEPPLWEKYHRELLGFIDAARAAMASSGSESSPEETPHTEAIEVAPIAE